MASVNPQEDVLKKLQGIKDSRGPVGQLARGNNMYPGGNAARTGGGPDIGRPPEAANAQGAIQETMQRMQQGNMPNANAAAPAQANAQQRMAPPAMKGSLATKLAKASFQAAAKRRMTSKR
jgi:hypothetical protein